MFEPEASRKREFHRVSIAFRRLESTTTAANNISDRAPTASSSTGASSDKLLSKASMRYLPKTVKYSEGSAP